MIQKSAAVTALSTVAFRAKSKASSCYMFKVRLKTLSIFIKNKAAIQPPYRAYNILLSQKCLNRSRFNQTIQITFCIQRGHTTGTGRRDGLAVDVVHDITRSKNAWNTGLSGVAVNA